VDVNSVQVEIPNRARNSEQAEPTLFDRVICWPGVSAGCWIVVWTKQIGMRSANRRSADNRSIYQQLLHPSNQQMSCHDSGLVRHFPHSWSFHVL